MKFVLAAVQGRQPPKPRELYTLQEQKAPLLDLLVKAEPTRIPAQRSELEAQSGAYLRDLLLAINPLDKDWVVKVNQVGCFPSLRSCRCKANHWPIGLFTHRIQAADSYQHDLLLAFISAGS